MQHLTNALTHAEPGRLSKALTGLQDGSLHISVTFRTAAEIRAEIVNGDKTPYAVVLTPERAFCSCKDAQYRQGKACSQDSPLLLHACKHALSLALWALQHPQEKAAETAHEQGVIHLCRPDDQPFCGREKTPKSWTWAQWPAYEEALTFEQVCETCVGVVWPRNGALNGATNTVQSGTRAAA